MGNGTDDDLAGLRSDPFEFGDEECDEPSDAEAARQDGASWPGATGDAHAPALEETRPTWAPRSYGMRFQHRADGSFDLADDWDDEPEPSAGGVPSEFPHGEEELAAIAGSLQFTNSLMHQVVSATLAHAQGRPAPGLEVFDLLDDSGSEE